MLMPELKRRSWNVSVYLCDRLFRIKMSSINQMPVNFSSYSESKYGDKSLQPCLLDYIAREGIFAEFITRILRYVQSLGLI